MRQYLRCREDFSSGLVHTALIITFLATLLAFGRALGHVFDHHGAQLSPWYRWATLGLVGLFMLSVLRRLYYKVMELWELRREMRHLRAGFREQEPASGQDQQD